MQILKFGGTSVGKPERMHHVAKLIDDGNRKVVVLSAVSGTTNKLVALNALLSKGDWAGATAHLNLLKKEYQQFIYELYNSAEAHQKGQEVLTERFQVIEGLFYQSFNDIEAKIVLAQGELISTNLFQIYLESQGINSALIPALEFMRTKTNGEPDLEFIEKTLIDLLCEHQTVNYFITQGYICKNADGHIDNLKRGGSDYTATLVGAALKGSEIQIWTDIDGMHNNDPRVVNNTFPIRNLSYREAAELAYFGAKILHPTCVLPAEKMDVPIRLKNTFDPQAAGTLISEVSSGAMVTAIAAKDKIVAINIHSDRMLMAYGFLRRVFQVFENHKTPIDMITTSEVAVSLTIDNSTHLAAIEADLKAFGEVKITKNQTIICIVGEGLKTKTGVAKKIFAALEEIPITMVAYGGSDNNVSILMDKAYKNLALNQLNEFLFDKAKVAN